MLDYEEILTYFDYLVSGGNFVFPLELGFDGVLNYSPTFYKLEDYGISFSTDRVNCPVTSIKLFNEDLATEFSGSEI